MAITSRGRRLSVTSSPWLTLCFPIPVGSLAGWRWVDHRIWQRDRHRECYDSGHDRYHRWTFHESGARVHVRDEKERSHVLVLNSLGRPVRARRAGDLCMRIQPIFLECTAATNFIVWFFCLFPHRMTTGPVGCRTSPVGTRRVPPCKPMPRHFWGRESACGVAAGEGGQFVCFPGLPAPASHITITSSLYVAIHHCAPATSDFATRAERMGFVMEADRSRRKGH